VLHVGRTECEYVNGGETRLLARRHVYDDGFLRGIPDDSLIRGLSHRNDARCIMRDVETLKIHKTEVLKYPRIHHFIAFIYFRYVIRVTKNITKKHN